MKLDIEGAEFDVVPRLAERGLLCKSQIPEAGKSKANERALTDAVRDRCCPLSLSLSLSPHRRRGLHRSARELEVFLDRCRGALH